MRAFESYERMPVLHALADAIVLPSLSETWGLVINEAFACGTPALVSDRCGAVDDLVERDHQSSEYVPLEEIKESDPERWRALVVEGGLYSGVDLSAFRRALAVLDHIRRVIGDDVHVDLQPARMRRIDQRLEIGVGAEMRIDASEIGDPVAVIAGAFLPGGALHRLVLEHRGDIETAHGRSAFSILIFQDLCLVPLVLIAPFLAGKGGQLMDLATLSGKAVLFLVAAAVAAKFLVNFLLNQVAKTKKREAFVLSVMLLCLGMAAATSHFGLSMALGAFIAGLFISTSKYNHQALGEIVTFREVFNSLVFVAIGMLFDVRILIENPILIAKVLLIVIVLKTLIGAGVTMLAGHSLRVAILTGVTIAQISEFSFVLSKLGLAEGLIDAQTNQVFLAVAILTMFVTPGFVYAGSFLNKWLEKVLPAGWMDRGTEMAGVEKFHMENHAIIVGYGNAGKDLARMFQSKGVPCVGLDMDPDVVREEHDSDIPVFYGDGGRQEVLAHAGIAKARFLALTVRDPDRSAVTVALCRRLNPDLYIVARARNSNEADALTAAGVSEVIMEESVIATQMFGGVEKKLQSK